MSDPYENKALLGAMVRDAAREAVHNADGPNSNELQRINNILVCEKFVSLLVDKGCMITRIPTEDRIGTGPVQEGMANANVDGRPQDDVSPAPPGRAP